MIHFLKLETDAELKKKLTSIARDNEIEDLKKLIYKIGDEEFYNRNEQSKNVYQKFIPYDAHNNYNNVENDVYYYQNNDVKRSGVKEMK